MSEAAAARWQRIESLFRAALDCDGSARERLLAAEPDADVAARVRRLLLAHQRAGTFLTGLDAAALADLLDEATAPAGGSIGRYQVIRELGGGAMGVVYLARDPVLGRDVALKLLPPRLAADETAKRRLLDEARAASALDHPAIATVFEAGLTDDGRPYIAMAAYDGETLRERLRRGALPVDAALDIARQLAAGLQRAHAHGIVHRDIKPENVMLTADDTAKILDFGIARHAGHARTQAGVLLGTVAYMSPEQTTGESVDGATDVWALGVVIYEMIAGRNPFLREDDRATVVAIRHDAPVPLDRVRSDVPAALAAVVERCLEKRPSARYGDGGALAAALGTAAAPVRQRPRAPRVAAAAAATLALLAVPLWLLVDAPARDPGDGAVRAAGAAPAAARDDVPAAARDAYLRGRYFWNRRDPASLQRALEQFQAALAVDPLYAEAWAGLADAYEMLASIDAMPQADAIRLARAAATRALELDDGIAAAHTALATILTGYDQDWTAAERHFRRALAIDPGSVVTHQRYATLLSITGRFDEAIAAVRRAAELDPLSSYARAAVGYTLYLSRDLDAALAHLRATRATDPAFGLTYVNLALTQLARGEPADAVATLQALERLWRDSPVTISLLGHALARAGRRDEAEAQRLRLQALAEQGYVSAFHFGVLRLGLDEHDGAIDALERAADQHAGLIQYIGVDPLFDPLRGQPRFRALLARLKLDAAAPRAVTPTG